MKDYSELVWDLREAEKYDNTDRSRYGEYADAIESLVRERESYFKHFANAANSNRGLIKQLSAIRAAVDALVDAWLKAGSPVAIGAALNVLEETVNGEEQPDHIRDATKLMPAHDSREAFDAWWINFTAQHEEWVYDDSHALRRQAWQAAVSWRDSQPQAEPVATKLETQQFNCFHVSAEDAERLKKLPVGTQLFTNPPRAEAVQDAHPDSVIGKYQRNKESQQPMCDKPETSHCIVTAPCAFCPHK